MKRYLVLGLILAVGLIGCEQAAEAAHYKKVQTVAVAQDNHDVAGVKVDAPNLVRIADNWSLGAEGGKDILKDVLYSDSRDYFESDKGYFAYVKLTYDGCLLNCKE